MVANRRQQRAALRRKVARYRGADLWALVLAAGVSPGVRHRWTSVQHLVAHAVAVDRATGKRVGPGQLEQLLADCVADEPGLLGLEDFVPEDPRKVVLVRLGPRVIRLFPGQIERPVADINRALLVSSAVDDLLVAHMGFGVYDVLEVVLGYADEAIKVLAPSWPSGALASTGDVRLAQSEFDAAKQLLDLGTPAHLQETECQRLALEWLTCESADLPYAPSHPQSPFGRYARVRKSDGEVYWLPLAFLPEILGYAVVELAHAAAALPGAEQRFATVVASDVLKTLWLFSTLVYGPIDASGIPIVRRHNGVQWVSMLTPRRVVLVQVVSSLRTATLPMYDLPEALRAARKTDGAIGVDMSVGQLTLVEGTEAVPLLIAASPGHIAAFQKAGLPAMSLDDLRWANSSADARTDLFTYCRDMSRADLPPFFGLEAINLWEWWRSNGKSFFTGGRAPDMLLVAPHAGTAEWRRAATLSELEQALLRLQLPAVRELAGIDDRGNGPHSVYIYLSSLDDDDAASGQVRALHRLPGLLGWTVHPSRVPVAVSALRTDWPEDVVDLFHELSIALCSALGAIDAAWTVAHEGSNIACYRIELLPRTADGEPALAWTDHERVDVGSDIAILSRLAVDCAALAAIAETNVETARDELAAIARGLLIAAGLGAEAAAAVEAAWRSTAPTFAVRIMRQPTVRTDLPAPVRLDSALISSVNRRVAEAVHANGVTPGEYKAESAKELDRDVLAPAALAELNKVLAMHRMDDLVRFGMRELERTINHKTRDLESLGQATALLPVGEDPLQRYREKEADYLTLRRSCEMAVEAALRFAPAGTAPVDEIAWGEILAAAHSYLQATTRSEGIHNQLSPTLLRISDSWEVTTEPDRSVVVGQEADGGQVVYQLDADAFMRAVAAERIADSWPKRTTLTASSDNAEDKHFADSSPLGAPETEPEVTNVLEREPAQASVNPDLDAAMLGAYGASGSDLVSTLFALAAWPLADQDSDAVAVERDAVLKHVLATTNYGSDPDASERAEAAIAMLVSTTTDLTAEDWKPWHARSRKRRLLVQPIPILSDGTLVVGPHLCFGAASMYLRYLQQGQLPWTQPQPPRAVDEALANVRDERNRALERQVGAVLRQQGWSVLERVKETKPTRLNVPTLRSEIDAVAGRAGEKIIWLLESVPGSVELRWRSGEHQAALTSSLCTTGPTGSAVWHSRAVRSVGRCR